MEEQAEEIKVQKEHKNAFGDFMEICESIVTSIFCRIVDIYVYMQTCYG